MHSKRFILGTVVSVLWVIISTALLYWKRNELLSMPPNAWGDFFAGCFAPLAFLWLVLGYLQQGEELNLSTKALQLQADELKNSVEQQRALVEVSRLQVEAERERLVQERRVRDEAIRPKFWVTPDGGVFSGDGRSQYSLVVANTGGMAAKTLAELSLTSGRTYRLIDSPIFESGQQQRTSFELASPLADPGAVLRISFIDLLGRDGISAFSVGRDDKNSPELEYKRLEA